MKERYAGLIVDIDAHGSSRSVDPMTKITTVLAAVLCLAACSSNPAEGPSAPDRPAAPERVAGKQFTVFFGSGTPAITGEADETLRDLVPLIREFAPPHIQVVGHADTAESDPDGLSKARADLVTQRLRALGVTTEIRTRSAGSKELGVETPAGTREAQNRRVTIEY